VIETAEKVVGLADYPGMILKRLLTGEIFHLPAAVQ